MDDTFASSDSPCSMCVAAHMPLCTITLESMGAAIGTAERSRMMSMTFFQFVPRNTSTREEEDDDEDNEDIEDDDDDENDEDDEDEDDDEEEKLLS